jgi:hypothetical protein
MSEWLRSVTRNHMGSARTGSNPVVDELFFFLFLKIFKLVTPTVSGSLPLCIF